MMRGVTALPGARWVQRAWILLALALAAVWPATAGQSASEVSSRAVFVLEIDGAIGPAAADYVSRGLDRAAEENAAIVILRMDTPGGLDTSMREIIRDILASRVPVASYVAPSGARAASAGTYIMYASHVAAMAPGTNLGAATPVAIGIGGPSPAGEPKGSDQNKKGEEGSQAAQPSRSAMEAKATNDAIAYIRSLAELRGRNADWAEMAVRDAASLSATEAKNQGVIDILAVDAEDLLQQAHGRTLNAGGKEITLVTRGLALVELTPDWRTRILSVITDPNVALIFMMVGIYGLIFEFMSPGAILPGVAGAISLLIGFYALAVLPVTFAGVALVLLGVALMIAEAFTPSLGALGIGGAIAFVFGATILIDPGTLGFEIQWPVVAALAAVSLMFSGLVMRMAVTSRRRPVVTGMQQMIGLTGRVEDWSGSRGHVFVRGESWNAVAPLPLVPGAIVRVTGMDGLTLSVVPVDAKEA